MYETSTKTPGYTMQQSFLRDSKIRDTDMKKSSCQTAEAKNA